MFDFHDLRDKIVKIFVDKGFNHFKLRVMNPGKSFGVVLSQCSAFLRHTGRCRVKARYRTCPAHLPRGDPSSRQCS